MQKTDDEILYTTIEQQIKKLKEQNLLIENDEFAKIHLEVFGYFNLIKGYRTPYIINSGNTLNYRSGVTFEQLTSLYLLDKNLRNAVIASMLDLEEHIKASSADVVADSFGIHQDDYLNFRNFRDKKRRNYQFSLAGIMKTMKNSLNTNKNPVLHYRNVHGIIPPWVLFKNLYFSTVVNLINLFKPREKEKMVHHLYDIDTLELPVENLKNIMMDTLFICLEYRNLAAHGGRVYNYSCESKFRMSNFDPNITDDDEPKGFSQLLFLLSLLKYTKPLEDLQETINQEVNRHCLQYPEDVTYLGQILNMNIIPQNIVWITEKSNKFHKDSYCSGIKNAIQIPYEDAVSKGYIACKRCIRN